jgi:hypothetical protein
LVGQSAYFLLCGISVYLQFVISIIWSKGSYLISTEHFNGTKGKYNAKITARSKEK